VKDASRHLVDLGATSCDTPAEVAEGSDIVILIVPDTPDVDAVLFGKDGAAAALAQGAILVDMSSISPLATKDFAEKVKALGADYVDAPVSGGETGARQGTLSIMVGGSGKAVAAVRPVLEILGKNITHVGEIGAGQTVKVANQIVVGLTIQAVSEAFLLARNAGVDLQVARDAMLGGFAQSRIMELHGQRMIDEAYEPGFKIALHRKDLNIALSSAVQLNVALPNTAGVVQTMNAAIAHGEGQNDHSAMFRTMCKLSGAE
jgi:2-hydroxy-3-oxopropionate reductase